jgi:hypothetical protein
MGTDSAAEVTEKGAKIRSRSSHELSVDPIGIRMRRISGRVSSPSIMFISLGCSIRLLVIADTATGRHVAERRRTGMLLVAMSLVPKWP